MLQNLRDISPSNELVSVIVPAYNAERFISDTITSVQAQTYSNWELLIVVDANSRDKTREMVIAAAAKDPRVRLLEAPHAKGATKNRNYGLEHARGKFIAFIDADDMWQPSKLYKQISFMLKQKIDFCYTGMTRVSEDLKTRGQPIPVPGSIGYKGLLKNNVIGCSTVVIRKSKLGDKRFQEEGWEDLSLWLALTRDGTVAHGIREPLTDYRVVKGSRSNDKFFAANLRWRTLRYVEKFSFLKSVYYFLFYAVTAAIKYRRF